MSIKPGDHVAVSRGAYTHHGISVGHGRVIHYSGEVARKTDASICEVSLERFAAGGEVYVVRSSARFEREEIVRRARSRIGERDYSVVANNCEHFARWCREGNHRSSQVERASERVTTGLSRFLVRLLSSL